MIFDKTLQFSDQQAVTATAASTNIIDLRAVGRAYGAAADLKRDLGLNCEPIPLLIQVTEAFTAAGAGTLTVTIETDDNEAFASPTVVWSSGAIGKAALVPGYRFGIIQVPLGVVERFVRLNYTVATGPMTAGKIVAGFVADVRTNPL